MLIITTRYDTLIEQAFRLANKTYDLVVCRAENPEFANAVLWWPHGSTAPRTPVPNSLDIDLSSTSVIFKIHGSVASIDVDVGFLIALREDSLSKLDRFSERIPNLLENRLVLRHLDDDGAIAAIRRPLDVWNHKYAQATPSTIEDSLVSEVIREVRPGRVSVGERGGSGGPQEEARGVEAPFVQLVMTRLWTVETSAGSPVIRLETYHRLGGAETIVRSHLDRAMAQLDATSQAVCARFFDRLVTPSGSKVACRSDDLQRWAGPLSASVTSVLEALAHARILRTAAAPENDPDITRYEIYHDVLAPAILDWRRTYVQAEERAERARTEAQEKRKKTLILLGRFRVCRRSCFWSPLARSRDISERSPSAPAELPRRAPE